MPNRAIDRHEEAILEVLHEVEFEGRTYEGAVEYIADIWGLTFERLDHLTRTWCAVGGFEVPS